MKLVIDRVKWLRGEGYAESMLLRPQDQKMCCLGFYCIDKGYTPEDILERTTPVELPEFDDLWLVNNYEFTEDLCRLIDFNDAPLGQQVFGVNSALAANKSELILEELEVIIESETQREEEIKKIFAKNDVEVEFI